MGDKKELMNCISVFYLYLQAADEGRKRANALPPLPMEREPTFHRPPRGFISLQNPEEVLVFISS
jgi:hypothetical protein